MKVDNRDCKILILSGESRNGLAIIRSLGAKGYCCDCVTHNAPLNRKMSLFFKSRYVRKVHFLPEIAQEKPFFNELVRLIKKTTYDFIIPAGTKYTNFLSKNKKKLSRYSRPLVEDYEKLWRVHDKKECVTWVSGLKIPVPKTFIINNYNDLIRASKQISYPVVIKNSDSFASEGLWMCPGGGEKLLNQYIQRNSSIQYEVGEKNDYPIIQEKIDGILVDSTSFSIDGKVIGMLTQQRLVTVWLDGGGGLVNITNDIEEIKRYATAIVGALKWTGPIEMDWIMESKTGRCYLLEINPKFWGTTQLTISSGLDYPELLISFAQGRRIEIPFGYVTGLMYRWLPDELYSILIYSGKRKRLIRELLNFCRRFNHKNVETDIWFADIRPALRNIFSRTFSYFLRGGVIITLKAMLNA